MANKLFMISNISFIFMIIFLAISIFLSVKFKIITIIGELSGTTAKKSIKRIRENNEKTGVKKYRPSKTNKNRGLITQGIYDKEINNIKKTNDVDENTQLLDDSKTEKISPKGTEVLNEEIVDVVNEKGTELLSSEEECNKSIPIKDTSFSSMQQDSIELNIIDDVMIIHTSEVIN